MEKIKKSTGVVAKIEGLKQIGKKNKEGREMVSMKLASEEKIGIIKEKRKLWNRKKCITDDMTERERSILNQSIDWLISKNADRESTKGKKVRVEYMKLWVEGKLWVK